MHEMVVVREVVDVVLDLATQQTEPARVSSVRLAVGEIRDIVDDLFIDMFAWMARGTAAEGATVTIDRIPTIVRCDQCGKEYHLDVFEENTWPCPDCKVRDYKLQTGNEFRIEEVAFAVDRTEQVA